MNQRNSVQWGQSVTIDANLVNSIYDEFTVFDSGRDLFSIPQVLTLTLDLKDSAGGDALWNTDDLWWARVEVGLGGYRRTFELDWYNGQQATFAANSIRVVARRFTGANPRSVMVRASVAVGARASSAHAPTWTSPSILPLPAFASILAPRHAKSFRIIGTDATFTGGLVVQQPGPSPLSNTLLTPAEVHALALGQFEIPVNAKEQRFSAAIGATGNIRVAYSLDL
jgi:hypothetical protein